MPLFIDGEQVNLYSLQQYQGDEVVRLKFKKAYRYLKETFWDKQLSVRFRHDKLTYGETRGRMAESYELSTLEDTVQGTKVIRYADNAVPKPNGTIEYRPPSLVWESRDMTFAQSSNIEKCLFIYLYICREGASPDVHLLNEAAEASAEMAQYEKSSAMHYFLFDKHSPLRTDDALLNRICASWGVHRADKITFEQKITQLKRSIEVAEANHDATRGYEAFAQAMEEGVTPLMKSREIYQRAIDNKKIRFNEEKRIYYYIDEAGKETDVLCKIPPIANLKRSEFLCEYLEKNPQSLETLEACLGDVGTITVRREKVELPGEVTREYLEGLAADPKQFNTMKRMLTDVGISAFKKTKKEILSALIDHFVTNKK